MSMERLPERKPNRLQRYDYSKAGSYFVTICVKDRRCVLSKIAVTDGAASATVELTACGEIVAEGIRRMQECYARVQVDRFVIMPNHVHLLLTITDDPKSGPPGSSAPTAGLPQMIAAFKKFTNRTSGESLWQRSYYDHLIRDREDYLIRCRYVDENPIKWVMGKDEYSAS